MRNYFFGLICNKDSYKNLFLFSLSLLLSLSAIAQDRGNNNYKRITSPSYLEQLLQEKTSAKYVITSEHTSKLSGVKHTYLRQAINGIEVCGTESSLHMDLTGRTITSHVNFVADIESSVKNASARITAQQAIENVAQQMGYKISNLQRLENASGSNQKGVFNGAGISSIEIPVRLVYYFKEGLGTILVWELSVMEINTSDWWNFRVDASSGTIIDKDNWTVNCSLPGDHSDEGHKAMAKNRAQELAQMNTNLRVEKEFAESSSLAQSYNVFALPKENPYDGPRSLEVTPANATASPLGWHNDGTTSFTYTKGNNVSAYDDGNNDNSAIVADHTPESAPGLIFDYAFDLTSGGNPIYNSGAQSEDAAITNLFYWNNIIHDIMYLYGLDEASGNFQENNFANGGAGGDSVNAEAQDSANLAPTGFNRCNANFGTPVDGGNPRMQMYICDGSATPGHNDGDFDSNVIVHEYAHGISNRLVGGPGVANALQNDEQMGEGWSDFYGYMLTMSATNATSDRAIGNFLFDLGPSGGGIRNAPYSTNLATNPWTYAGVANTSQISRPHGIGFIWATMLYEMTQALVARDGYDPDLYNGSGGNNTAIALVTEGLKLTPISPGFVDGRDAILAADLALNGGVNHCLIWTAFAKRGLGFSASQGSSASRTDGVEAFDLPVATLVPSRTDICINEGLVSNITGGSLIGGVYSGTYVTDGGNGQTFSFDAAAAGVGIHTVSYTDPCTATVAMANITVSDGVPIVSCNNITLTLDGSGMAVYDPNDSVPDTLVVVGGNNSSNNPGSTRMQVPITQSGSISFDWLFESSDSAGFDDFGYTLNGSFTNLSNGAAYPASGNSSVPVTSGDIFSFTVNTDDNVFGAGTATITNFTPGFLGQFDEANWTEILTNSDGSATFSGFTPTITISGDCGVSSIISASQTIFTCNDIGDNIVTISADNGLGIGACEATVTIIGPTSTYNLPVLGGWDTPPTSGTKALFQSDYNTSLADITACSCEIASGSTLTVDAGGFLDITGNITVGSGSTLVVEHEGSVRQISDDAVVTNNGTINVELTTPNLDSRDFMVLGSPMSNSAREGVWNTAFLVLNHLTANFLPNLDVEAVLGGAENFADDNYDNWVIYPSGPIDVGEGYIVRPQSGYGQPGGIFNYTFSQGTLNNGVVNFPIIYNTVGTPAENRNASPNVLANPYPSAIFADDFINANPMIDAVYFWEHLTPPSPAIPGAGAMNFDMEDISMYNLMGGTAAANDPGSTTTPNGYISTGQGFAVKASSAGVAVFNNSMRRTSGNNTLNRPIDLNRERIWINVSQEEYELQSQTLIGFSSEATAGIDPGYDSRRLATILSIYSHLEDGSEQLGIQSRENYNSGMRIPLGFSTLLTDKLKYSISIADIEGSQLEQATIYLIDHQENIIVNLSQTGHYYFRSEEGTYHQRFSLFFRGGNRFLNSESNAISDAIGIYPNPTKDWVNIASPLMDIQGVRFLDLQGRVVATSAEHAKLVQLNIAHLQATVYFVEITTELGVITKRLVKQ